MNGKIIQVITVTLLLLFASFKLVSHSVAQESSFGVTSSLVISDKNVKDGDIVSYTPTGYILSKTEYDPMIVGVVNTNPAVSIDIQGVPNTYPVMVTGNAVVNVSTVNGAIKKGDPITSSKTKGTGMKATTSGYILGSALEDYSAKNPNEVGKILVSLNIYYYYAKSPETGANLFNILQTASMALAQKEAPSTVLKYIVAALVILASIILGFFSFGRIAASGIEAMGRNPLAGKMIQIGIILNVLITISIIASGIAVAYFIVRL